MEPMQVWDIQIFQTGAESWTEYVVTIHLVRWKENACVLFIQKKTLRFYLKQEFKGLVKPFRAGSILDNETFVIHFQLNWKELLILNQWISLSMQHRVKYCIQLTLWSRHEVIHIFQQN